MLTLINRNTDWNLYTWTIPIRWWHSTFTPTHYLREKKWNETKENNSKTYTRSSHHFESMEFLEPLILHFDLNQVQLCWAAHTIHLNSEFYLNHFPLCVCECVRACVRAKSIWIFCFDHFARLTETQTSLRPLLFCQLKNKLRNSNEWCVFPPLSVRTREWIHC